MEKRRLILFLALILLTVPIFVHADVFLKQKKHTDSYQIMGQHQPAKDEFESIWVAKDKIRSDGKEHSTIVRLDKKVMYILDHAKKTYMEIPMDIGKSLPELNIPKGDEKDVAAFKNMMKNMMKVNITVVPTGEKKKIRNWNCKKYIETVSMVMGQTKMIVWATEDIKINYNLYAKFAASMFAQIPGMKDAMGSMEREMEKVKGLPVLTITERKVMGQTVKSTTELLEVKHGKAPTGIFEIPKGYTKTEMMEGE